MWASFGSLSVLAWIMFAQSSWNTDVVWLIIQAQRSSQVMVEVRDRAEVFGCDAERRAREALQRIHRKHRAPVHIETIKSLDGAWIADVAGQRARTAKAEQLYILVARGERDVAVISARQGPASRLTDQERESIRRVFLEPLQAGELQSLWRYWQFCSPPKLGYRRGERAGDVAGPPPEPPRLGTSVPLLRPEFSVVANSSGHTRDHLWSGLLRELGPARRQIKGHLRLSLADNRPSPWRIFRRLTGLGGDFDFGRGSVALRRTGLWIEETPAGRPHFSGQTRVGPRDDPPELRNFCRSDDSTQGNGAPDALGGVQESGLFSPSLPCACTAPRNPPLEKDHGPS